MLQIITDATGMAGGDFTQMGKVVGSGGGVKRVIDTNIKRMPAGEVQFNADGGVSLESLGLGGAEGANIIRQTVRVEPVGNGQFVGAGTSIVMLPSIVTMPLGERPWGMRSVC
jgi:hypothetical protein